MPDPLTIETAGLKAWPGVEVEWNGQWVLRASNGFTRRANSVQCFDPADDSDIEARVEYACRWFEARGLTPVFRVNLLTGPALLGHLDAGGWASEGHSVLMAMPLAPAEPDPRAEILAVDDPRFLAAQQQLKQYDEPSMEHLKAILAAMEVPACGVVLLDASKGAVSSALMTVADGIVITGNVVTHPAERRQGHAAAMMRTGLAWAREQGATVAALNVEASNQPALALYRGLGYASQYSYVYRHPGRN